MEYRIKKIEVIESKTNYFVDTVKFYRNYYKSKQSKMKMGWGMRDIPNWMKGE